MIWIYVAALIFGGSFVIPMAISGMADLEVDGGDFGDVDLDLDLDADLDLVENASGSSASTSPTGTGATADILGRLVSIPSILFFATFFGLAGAAFTLFDFGEPTPALSGITVGLLAAVLYSWVFTYVGRSESDSRITSADMAGARATVVVPIEPGKRGRVRVDLAGQPKLLTASSLRGTSMHPGDRVLVVKFAQGVASVVPADDFELPASPA